MNLQPATSLRAVKSPCRQCLKFATAEYPNCNEVCKAVNTYLQHLGDKPILQAKNKKPLWEQFPVKSSGKVDPRTLASEEDTEAACQKITDMRDSGMKPKELAAMFGISQPYVNCMIRRGLKRMSKDRLRQIMEVE